MTKPVEQPKVEKPVTKPVEQPKVEKPVTKPVEQPKVEKPVVKPVEQAHPSEQHLSIRRRKFLGSGQLSHRYYLRSRHQYTNDRLSVRRYHRHVEPHKQDFHLASAIHKLISNTH